jgi:hypothetical protein
VETQRGRRHHLHPHQKARHQEQKIEEDESFVIRPDTNSREIDLEPIQEGETKVWTKEETKREKGGQKSEIKPTPFFTPKTLKEDHNITIPFTTSDNVLSLNREASAPADSPVEIWVTRVALGGQEVPVKGERYLAFRDAATALGSIVDFTILVTSLTFLNPFYHL